LGIGDNRISADGTKGLAAGLRGSALQALDLSSNNIGDESAKELAAGLPGSALQTLLLFSNGIGDEGAKELGAGLSGSALQNLVLFKNVIGAEGAKGLGGGLFGSALQRLDLNFNDIGSEGAKGLAAGLPGSALQMLYLDNNGINGIGDEGAEAIAAQLTTTVQVKSQISWITSLNPDIKRALAQAEPNTNLTSLMLNYNKINTTGAIALCRVLPQTQISVTSLGLRVNPSDPRVVDPETCVISSSIRLQPPLPYRVFYQAYVIATAPIVRLYASIKSGFAEKETHSSVAQATSTSETPKAETKPAVTSAPVVLPKQMQAHSTSTTFTVLKTLTTSSESTALASYNQATTTPDLNITLSKVSLDNNLIAARWGAYYVRNIIDHVAKHSPFTLPWNREQALSTTTENQLQAQQKQLQSLTKIITEQQASRTGKNTAFNDQFIQMNALKSDTEKKIQAAFKTKKISSSSLKTITQNISKIEKIIHEVSDYNRQLKKSAVKVRRAATSVTHKKEQLVVITKKDFVRGTCA